MVCPVPHFLDGRGHVRSIARGGGGAAPAGRGFMRPGNLPALGWIVQGTFAPSASNPQSRRSGETGLKAELDLLVVAGNRRFGFEVKRAEAPRPTSSMRSAFETLGLDRLDVVHAGTESYAMAPGIRALPAARLATELRLLRE